MELATQQFDQHFALDSLLRIVDRRIEELEFPPCGIEFERGQDSWRCGKPSVVCGLASQTPLCRGCAREAEGMEI